MPAPRRAGRRRSTPTRARRPRASTAVRATRSRPRAAGTARRLATSTISRGFDPEDAYERRAARAAHETLHPVEQRAKLKVLAQIRGILRGELQFVGDGQFA